MTPAQFVAIDWLAEWAKLSIGQQAAIGGFALRMAGNQAILEDDAANITVADRRAATDRDCECLEQLVDLCVLCAPEIAWFTPELTPPAARAGSPNREAEHGRIA